VVINDLPAILSDVDVIDLADASWMAASTEFSTSPAKADDVTASKGIGKQAKIQLRDSVVTGTLLSAVDDISVLVGGQVMVIPRATITSITIDWLATGTLRIVCGANPPQQLAIRGTLRADAIEVTPTYSIEIDHRDTTGVCGARARAVDVICADLCDQHH
jgi:hypothetical protein